MQDTKTKASIWKVVKPFYWILRIFGLAIFSINGDIGDGKITTNFHNIFQMIIVLSAQFYLLYFNSTNDFYVGKTSSFLIDKGAYCLEIFNALNVLMGTLIFTFYRKKIWKIFSKLNVFDEEVNFFP